MSRRLQWTAGALAVWLGWWAGVSPASALPPRAAGMVPAPTASASSGASSRHSGAWANAGVLPFGDAQPYGAPTKLSLSSPVVGMAATHDGAGYWLVAADGGMFSYGDAAFYGSAGSINLFAPIVGIAATPDGKGYWQVALDGGVFAYGSARFYGSMGGHRLNQPIVGMAATPDGKGYWLVALDGGIFSFGDAHFYGSTGSIVLNSPIVGMASSSDGHGYWLVAADGGIFTYGDATFYGSTGGRSINAWIAGMAPTADGAGYWLAGADGTVYGFGDAVSYGDLSSAPRKAPIAGIVATHSGRGYWLLEPDAFPVAFRHPGGGGSIVAAATSQVQADPVPGYFCNPYGPCEAWCALFATWVWESAGVAIPRYAFVGDVYTWAAAHTAVVPPTGTPRVGYAVLYGTGPQNVDTAVHMGIVAQVWPDGAIVTVEGDSGPEPTGSLDVTINGPFLPSDSLTYNGFGIFAYAVP